MKLSRQRIVRASPEAVWQATASVESIPHWLSGVESAALLSGPADGGGRRQRLLRTIAARDVEIEQEVVAWEPGRLMRVRHLRETSGGRELQAVRNFQMTLELVPAGEGTRVRAAYSWDASGLPWIKSILFAGRIFGRELTDTLKKIERLVAGGPKST